MFWDERYNSENYIYGTQANIFLQEIAHHLPSSGRALDLAAGEGRNAVFLAERGLSVTAADASSVGLAKAQRLAESRGVRLELVQADLCSHDWQQGSYDVVSSVFFQLPPPLRLAVGRRAVNALRVGGLLVAVFYHSEQLALGTGGPSNPEFLGSLADWQAMFPDLEWLHAEHRRHVLNEGELHQGESSVVYLLGRKPFQAA